MSKNLDVPVVSSVRTRSQTSRRSEAEIDKLEVLSEPKIKTAETVFTEPKIKAAKSIVSNKSSRVHMSLFGDVDLEVESLSEAEEDVSSVSSKLHVSLDDIKNRIKGARSLKSKERSLIGSDSQGSMTKSELYRLNIEISKMEIKGKLEAQKCQLASKTKIEEQKLKIAREGEEQKLKVEAQKIKLKSDNQKREFELKKIRIA
jgi:hypothetical protein